MNLGVRTETSLFERDTIEPAIPPKVTEVVALRLPPEIVTVVPPVAVPTTGVAEVTMGSRAKLKRVAAVVVAAEFFNVTETVPTT
jgi:hypothetical protein